MFKLSRIRRLQKTCGTYATAKHLKAQGFDLGMALAVLARSNRTV
jgi:hypothetical protein